MSLIGTAPRKLNESGQAVVEYMLVLVIVVLICITALYQFSTSFRAYTDNFFGNYIMCLMESGELPGSNAGECKNALIAFDIKLGTQAGGGSGDGSVPTGDGNSGGSSGGVTSSTGGTSSSSKSASQNSSKSGSGSSSSGTSSSSGQSGSSGSSSTPPSSELGSSGSDSGSSFGSRTSTRKTTKVANANAAGAGGKGKGKEGLKAISTDSTSYSRSDSGRSGKRTALGSNFTYSGQEDKEEEAKTGSRAVAKNEGNGLKSRKISSIVVNAPKKVDAEADTGFSVGGFVRVLLIAAILIAIFVLFGGQILAISKGGEK